MKKIYIFAAVLALLTLSLNAQQLTTIDRSQLKTAYTNPTTSFYNTLKSIKGMSGILPEVNPNGSSSAKGQSRAPLKINSDETTVGPFTGDYFDPNAGMGFGNAYDQAQMILIEVDMDRSEYANYIGEEIVGFRLALAGDATRTVQVGQFIAWPFDSNGSFEQDNRHTWSIGELTTPAGNPYYEKVTSTSGLESGAEYLIVYENDNVAFNGGLTTLDVGNNVISVNRNGTIIESNATTDAATFTITANGNYYTIRSKSGYYIGRTSSRNGMDTNANSAYNNSITFSNNNVVIRGRGTTNNNTYYLRFNSSSGNDYYRFRYYAQNSQQNIQLYKKVTPTAPAYVALQDGQWHEFYLDNPVTLNVGSDNAGLSLGYTYVQYPTGTTGQNLFPIGINPQSTTHDHYANLTMTTSGNGDIVITVPSYDTMFQTITVTDNNTGNTLTSWSSAETTVTDGTYTYYQMPSGWTLSGVYMFTYTTSGYTFGYLSSDSESSITISSSLLNGSDNVSVTISGAALEEGQYVDVNGDSRSLTSGYTFSQSWNPVDLSGGSSTTTGFVQLDFSQYGDLAVQLIFKRQLTPVLITPEDGSTVNVGTNEGSGVSTTITVSGENLTQDLTVSVTGDGFSVSPTTISAADANAGTATVTITYTGTDPNATGTLTISSGEVSSTVNLTASYDSSTGRTPMPQINYEVSSDGEHVTITATGDGTVTLNVPGYDPVSGQGEASITIPCGAASNTITVTATAQEDGLEVSNPATAQITIPAGSDWVEMTGTYNNPNDLLSFQVKVGNDTIDIMLIDQFLESTLKNEHPDHYTYTLRQTVNGETQTSTPVSIPVYKTNSTMQGLYTKNQVDIDDKNMSLKPNVVNTEMDFDVNPDRNVLYYSLYRGDLNATYPEITAQSRISQLQKFEEIVGEGENAQPQYFLFESHQTGIAPRYDRLGTGIAERLDTNWVEAAYDDNLAYVPVIWTFGLYTARGDGKNNSYGSDIKREYMGKVDATITGTYTAGNDYGTWKVGETEYCVFHPTITVTGLLPQNNNNNVVLYNDEDEATYVPYMCRAWCTYEGIHDFIRNSDGNLQDAGALPTPYWLGDAIFDGSNTATIGGEWTGGATRDQWSFGLPSGTNPNEVTYIIRFYYKKVVTEGQPQQNGSQGKFIGGAAEEYFMAETGGEFGEWVVGVNELYNGIVPVDVTYVNPQGMKSSRPFDGVNIVVTRYSDGSTRTTKIIR